MNLHHQDNTTKVIHGDCIETMNQMEPESVDAIVTDPPYGLGFMGKKWDDLPPSREWAEACYRVLKPGGHIAAFGGTRTWHRLAVAIEDAGFEMRDSLAWLYGSGFPKSHDVGKAIDKLAGAEREVTRFERVGIASGSNNSVGGSKYVVGIGDTPATPEAERWDGWGTALKPAFEPIVLARKPLAEKTVARNVLAHGTGAINIDGCRIGRAEGDRTEYGRGHDLPHANTTASLGKFAKVTAYEPDAGGRWPANVLLDQHAAAWVDEQSGITKSNVRPATGKDSRGKANTASSMTVRINDTTTRGVSDQGGASRFFYTAKAPKSERPNVDGVQHPTVKPLAIMEWLIRLVTPPGGTVLDPFAGSGTTIEAARKLGFKSIGIEAEETYLPLIDQRLQRSNTNPIELEGVGE